MSRLGSSKMTVIASQRVPDGEGGYTLSISIEPIGLEGTRIEALLPGFKEKTVLYHGQQSIVFLRNLRTTIDAALSMVGD